MKISAYIITLNEEQNIKDCIKSLDFCDEIVIIDSHSNDNTCKIAKSLKARVIQKDMAHKNNLAQKLVSINGF